MNLGLSIKFAQNTNIHLTCRGVLECFLELTAAEFDEREGSRLEKGHSSREIIVQSPLGFATLDKAAALVLATATPLTDLRQYINSDLGFSDLEI